MFDALDGIMPALIATLFTLLLLAYFAVQKSTTGILVFTPLVFMSGFVTQTVWVDNLATHTKELIITLRKDNELLLLIQQEINAPQISRFLEKSITILVTATGIFLGNLLFSQFYLKRKERIEATILFIVSIEEQIVDLSMLKSYLINKKTNENKIDLHLSRVESYVQYSKSIERVGVFDQANVNHLMKHISDLNRTIRNISLSMIDQKRDIWISIFQIDTVWIWSGFCIYSLAKTYKKQEVSIYRNKLQGQYSHIMITYNSFHQEILDNVKLIDDCILIVQSASILSPLKRLIFLQEILYWAICLFELIHGFNQVADRLLEIEKSMNEESQP